MESSLHCQDEREWSLPTTENLHNSYSGKGLDLYNKPFSARRHPKSWTSSPKTWADLLLKAESRLPCTWDRTFFCWWEPHPIPIFFFQLRTQHVSPQRTDVPLLVCFTQARHCAARTRTWIGLVLVLGLIMELMKLHTFPKSCLKSSRAQPPLS